MAPETEQVIQCMLVDSGDGSSCPPYQRTVGVN